MLVQYNNIRAAYIWRNNREIYCFERENLALLHPVGCIFKAVISTLIGMAIYEEAIDSVDDRIEDYFPEVKFDGNWHNLRIEHALSKTTGLHWPGPGENLPDTMREIAVLPFDCEPGAEFRYKPDPQIAVLLLERIYGKPVTALFKERIGRYLDEYSWERENIEGMKASVQMLEGLGRIWLEQGQIGNTRLFSEEYCRECMKPASSGGFPERLPYRRGWWLGSHKGIEYMMASGFGGQILAVVPDTEMIAVILSDMDRPHPENRRILEGMIDGTWAGIMNEYGHL